jgi:hypothetical protein
MVSSGGVRFVMHWSSTLFAVVAVVGCKPDLQGRPSLIDAPRVLAIGSVAAEASPGDNVTYDVLVAGPSDVSAQTQFDWALCNARKPLAESGPIAQVCLQPSASELQALGNSVTVSATIPKDVCQVFGPITPVQKAGEPSVRPEDPDTTGGYYQPVRLLTRDAGEGDQYEVGVTRLLCGIALGASQENTLRFTKEYRANTNPAIDALELDLGSDVKFGIDFAEDSSPKTVRVGSTGRFNATWAACPGTPGDASCTGSEAYLSFDAAQQALLDRRESIRISWYATDGSFEHDRTGRTEAEAGVPSTSNNWTAPDSPSRVQFWLVIRDDRRGVSWVTFELDIVA